MTQAVATVRRFDEADEARIIEVGPGDLFEVGPGHDSVVVGDERYVTIHFLGADEYAAK